ncbi:hypothetical protein RQM65_05470 [Pricia sp. S334]|uniref:Secreted protein n=1 Tax=Pricia mediterranea TaxID=3076079 RepID=A0ABU3L4C7_9FLAO|nr:hypothetical protein [Pricia sp. S334]MDT7828113.1 hypothetical protein [Pricia sp. S334]
MKLFKQIFALVTIVLISSNLSAQEITAFPGTWGESFYQDKEKLTWKEVDKIMMDSQVAQNEWRKSKKLALGGLISGVANLGSVVWLVSNLDQSKPLTGPIIATVGTGAIGMIFFKAASENKRKAILNYNDSLSGGTSFRLVPVNNQNGTGLALKF